MERHETLDRRGFLARGLWSLAAFLLWPRSGAASSGRILGLIQAPGQEVLWEGAGPGTSGWFVHRCNGVERSRRRVNALSGGISLVGLPRDGTLEPGVHEFLLETGGRRVFCGGFQVAAFRFGC